MLMPLKSGSWHTPVEIQWVGPLELPALGYLALPYAALPTTNTGLTANQNSIGNGRVQLEFDLERGGLRSFKLDGNEYARHGEFGFSQVVLERPEGGLRQEIYGSQGWDSPETVHLRWHPDWKAVREGPVRLLESSSTLHAGCAEFVQVLEMSTGDHLTNHYRVFPDEANLELEVVLDKVALDDPHALCTPCTCAFHSSLIRTHAVTSRRLGQWLNLTTSSCPTPPSTTSPPSVLSGFKTFLMV
jgi:hypothetical protein